MRARLALLFTIVLALVACSRERSTTTAPTTSTPHAIRDLASVMARAPFVFRPAPSGALGVRLDHYQAEEAQGALTITPRGGAPARFSEANITIGDATIGAPRTHTVDDDGAVVLDRGEVVERIRADERGVELTWTLPARVRGPLSLRVAVSGATSTGVTASGAHFADPSGRGVRVSHAVVVDANGARTEVPLAVDGNALVVAVDETVLARAAYPLTIDPVISPEIGMDTPIASYAAGTQSYPQIACGTTNCLTVWIDARSGEDNIFGARIDNTGAVLDAYGIPIAMTRNAESAPAVAWNGSNYFVSWLAADENTAFLVRIDPSGTVLGAPKSFVHDGARLPIACSPAVCLLVTQSSTGVSVVRVDPAGAVLDSTVILPGSRLGLQDLAHSAGTFLFAYHDASTDRVMTVRVDGATGRLVDTPRQAITSTAQQVDPTLGAGPSGFYLAIIDLRFDSLRGDVLGARIGLDGVSLDPSGVAVRRNSAAFEELGGVVFDGSNFQVLWTERNDATFRSDVMAARVNGMGKVVDSSPITIGPANTATSPCTAFDGTKTVISYVTDTSSARNLSFRTMTPSGVVSAPTALSLSANAQGRAIASWNGSRWLVAWEDVRGHADSTTDIYAVRLDAAGAVLDPTSIVVTATAAHPAANPAIASDGSGWFVVWNDSRAIVANQPPKDVYGARVGAAGNVLDPAGVAILTPGNADAAPAIAFDGTDYLVAWGSSAGVGAVRVSTTGALVMPRLSLFGTTRRAHVSLAFDGTNHLIVADDGAPTSGLGSTQDVYGVLVSKAGTTVGTPFVISNAIYGQGEPRVAFGGGVFFAVWADRRGGKDFDIYGARISPTGTVLDPSGLWITGTTTRAEAPDVAFDGNDFFVVWEHYGTTSIDVRGAIVSPSGALRAPSPFPITSLADDETRPRIAASSKTRHLVTYTRFDLSPTLRTPRVYARFVDGLTSGACTTTAECLSGICTDGVCCDSACTGQCESCVVTGKSGFCSAVIGSPLGRPACSGAGAGTSCGARCDGVDRTKCTYAPADATVCSSTACVGGIETHASTCDGAGSCKDTPTTCGAYACGGTTCRTSCSASTECAPGFACKDSACVPSLTLGDACTTTAQCTAGLFCTDSVCCAVAACGASESCSAGKGRCIKLNGGTCSLDLECSSNHCVDGVCCDTTCGGQCEACDTDGNKGKCVPVSGAPHGASKACATTTDICAARNCDGVDVTSCKGFASGTTIPCAPARCDGELFFAAATCTGAGTCGATTGSSCVPYACAKEGCRTSCTTASDCAAGFECRGAKCEAVQTTCTPDQLAVESITGERRECAPYLCRAGACLGRCESSAECSDGATCDAENHCVPRPPRVEVEDSGGCGYAPRGTGSWFILAFAALAFARKRRAS